MTKRVIISNSSIFTIHTTTQK